MGPIAAGYLDIGNPLGAKLVHYAGSGSLKIVFLYPGLNGLGNFVMGRIMSTTSTI